MFHGLQLSIFFSQRISSESMVWFSHCVASVLIMLELPVMMSQIKGLDVNLCKYICIHSHFWHNLKYVKAYIAAVRNELHKIIGLIKCDNSLVIWVLVLYDMQFFLGEFSSKKTKSNISPYALVIHTNTQNKSAEHLLCWGYNTLLQQMKESLCFFCQK